MVKNIRLQIVQFLKKQRKKVSQISTWQKNLDNDKLKILSEEPVQNIWRPLQGKWRLRVQKKDVAEYIYKLMFFSQW